MWDGLERWRGRVALVTGASSGIGRAVARDLLRGGLRVAVLARRRERLEALAEEARAAGGQVLPLPADLRDEAEVLAAFEALRAAWGGTDVLVNAAGLGRAAPLTEGPAADWREMLEVNVLGLCLCTWQAVRDMRGRGDDGHVVHVSSMSGYRVPRASGVYAASKHAVRALTEALRLELRELGSGIRVSAVSPGFVETEFSAVYHRDEGAAARTYGRYRVLQADDVASAVRFVLAAPPHVQVHDVLVRPTEQPR